MGSKPAWDNTDWASYARTSTLAARAGSYQQVFTNSTIDPDLDPKRIHTRESRNSITNPATTPILVGIDTTGSMGQIPYEIVKKGMGVFGKEAFERKIVPGPHLLFAGIGDLVHDSIDTTPDNRGNGKIPFQVTQFESDIKALDQMLKFANFGGGGGNHWESYNALWHFAAYHTSCDAWEKDGRLGYLFTVGDEECPPDMTIDNLVALYGENRTETLATNEFLISKLASMYHVYHIVIAQGSHVRNRPENMTKVKNSFSKYLGNNVLILDDHTKLSELIISAIQVNEGKNPEEVALSWQDPKTSAIIRKALTGSEIPVERSFGSIMA